MDKNYINVQYDDKDLAKQLGAKWDGEKKSWYYYDRSQLARIKEWFPPRIKTKTEIVYVRFKTAEEILEHLGIKKEQLHRLDTKDKDMRNCIMVSSGDNSLFFMDIYSKSDLSSEEIRILEKWLKESIPEI